MKTALKTVLAMLGLAAGLGLAAIPAQAQGAGMQGRMQMQDRTSFGPNTVYGWQLMTPEERDRFHLRMRNANTWEERGRIRTQHHIQMQRRARQQGVGLPAVPPARGGMGYGMGSGPRGKNR